jgi:hypothetical protein
MTQTIVIDAFEGHDPAVEMWSVACRNFELREVLADLLDTAAEKTKTLVKGVGHTALEVISDMTS